MKSAAALLPLANDFIASSCSRLSACILMPLASSLSVMFSTWRGRGRLTSITVADLRWNVCHDQYAIGEVNRLVYVCCHEKCCTAKLVVQVCIIFLHQTLRHGIEAAKRLVKIITLGRLIIERANSARRCMPPESCEGYFLTERRKTNFLQGGLPRTHASLVCPRDAREGRT